MIWIIVPHDVRGQLPKLSNCRVDKFDDPATASGLARAWARGSDRDPSIELILTLAGRIRDGAETKEEFKVACGLKNASSC
jgi:hypothetical protein